MFICNISHKDSSFPLLFFSLGNVRLGPCVHPLGGVQITSWLGSCLVDFHHLRMVSSEHSKGSLMISVLVPVFSHVHLQWYCSPKNSYFPLESKDKHYTCCIACWRILYCSVCSVLSSSLLVNVRLGPCVHPVGGVQMTSWLLEDGLFWAFKGLYKNTFALLSEYTVFVLDFDGFSLSYSVVKWPDIKLSD